MPEEEGAICHALQQMNAYGWPISISRLKSLAQQLLAQKVDFKPLGIYYTLFYIITLTFIL